MQAIATRSAEDLSVETHFFRQKGRFRRLVLAGERLEQGPDLSVEGRKLRL